MSHWRCKYSKYQPKVNEKSEEIFGFMDFFCFKSFLYEEGSRS